MEIFDGIKFMVIFHGDWWVIFHGIGHGIFDGIDPLGNVYHFQAIEAMAIEIDDLPFKKWWCSIVM